MNERIRKLNMQAAEYATSVCPSHSRDWYPIQNAKFAELIVRECITVLDKKDPDFNDYSKRVVKEHFGVE